MNRRAFLSIATIVFTLASSLGESLHALPGLSHGDAASACHVRTDHMEAPAEGHDGDCPVCQAASPFQAIAAAAAAPLAIEICGAWVPPQSCVFITDCFEILSARGPPLG